MYLGTWWQLSSIAVLGLLFLIFRDPRRKVPPAPAGVVSPVDGSVIEVAAADRGVLQGSAHRIVIRVDSLGTYTARSPVEGRVMDLASHADERPVDYETKALWIQTDEGDDIVLQFDGYRFGLAPSSFVRFGERLGQGSRFAHLRLTRRAEVHVPIDSRVLVEPGQRVVAGQDLIARLRPA